MIVRRLSLAFVVCALVFPLAPAGASATAPSSPFALGNVNTSKVRGNQSETAMAIQQTNPSNVVGVSNLETGAGMTHVWSRDGGATWQHEVIADGDPLGDACCDGQLASDEFGNIFLVWVSAGLQVKVGTSTDGGATFQLQATLTPRVRLRGPRGPSVKLPSGDQPSVAAATGSLWVSWTSFSSGIVQAAGAPVAGLGQVGAFGPPQTTVGHNKGDYGDTVIGPNGQVMLVYQNPTGGEGPAVIYTALDPDGLGGQGFQQSQAVTSTNVGGFDYIPAQSGRSVDSEAALAWDLSGGPHQGRLYLMYTSEEPQESDDLDIRFRYSDDMGGTWTAPVRVNDDATTRSQFLPKMAIDQTTGSVAITWYDCRNDAGLGGPGDTNGRPNDDAVLYGTVTRTGGQSFIRNFRIGAGVSNAAQAQSGVDYGDYEGLAFHAGTFYPLWADNSNSTHDNPDGRLNEFDLYTAAVVVP